MAFNVTIVAVTQESGKSANGPYTYTNIKYDFKGEDRNTKIFPSAYKNNQELKKSVEGLKAGDRVQFEMVKDEKGYSKLSEIIRGGDNHISDTTTSQTASGTVTHVGNLNKNYRSDNEIGLQVGNALTNAVNSLGAKSTISQIKDRALEIIKLGNELKEIIKSGKLDESDIENDNANRQLSQDLHPIDDEDIPF